MVLYISIVIEVKIPGNTVGFESILIPVLRFYSSKRLTILRLTVREKKIKFVIKYVLSKLSYIVNLRCRKIKERIYKLCEINLHTITQK